MIAKATEEIFKKIVARNLTAGSDSIPHSDTFFKEVESNVGVDINQFRQIINILKESHKILIITISKEDKNRNLEKIEGYVDADISTVRKLWDYFQRILVEMYEEESHKRMPVHQIIRELFPRLDMISKTPLGYVANKAIMLDEFEKLLEKEFLTYNEDYKAKKLSELLYEFEKSTKKKKSTDDEKATPDKEEVEPRRAVDSKQFKKAKDFSKSSLNKILQIYGVEFFLRINLRKYNFDLIRELIENRQIDDKRDIKKLNDMINNMKMNTGRDPKLLDFSQEIKKLERSISKFIGSKRY